MFRLARETAAEQGMPARQLRFVDLDAGDLIDAVAHALGLFMSPRTRDETAFDVVLWSRRRHNR